MVVDVYQMLSIIMDDYIDCYSWLCIVIGYVWLLMVIECYSWLCILIGYVWLLMVMDAC